MFLPLRVFDSQTKNQQRSLDVTIERPEENGKYEMFLRPNFATRTASIVRKKIKPQLYYYIILGLGVCYKS